MKRQYIVQYVTAKTPQEQAKALEKLKETGCWMLV